MSFKAEMPDLNVLQCQRCRVPISSTFRPVKLVGTTGDIRMLVIDGISIWCKRCHIATEYKFTDSPAVEVA